MSERLSARQRRNQGFAAADRDRTGVPNEWFEMTPFIRFDRETGEILEHGTMSLGGLRHLEETQGWAWLPQRGDPDLYWVNPQTKRRRVKSVCPAVLDGLTLRDLPQPCRIEIAEPATGTQVYEETEAALELSFEHPGIYTIRVLSTPHTPGEFEVTVP